jgi:hypothetical protein
MVFLKIVEELKEIDRQIVSSRGEIEKDKGVRFPQQQGQDIRSDDDLESQEKGAEGEGESEEHFFTFSSDAPRDSSVEIGIALFKESSD